MGKRRGKGGCKQCRIARAVLNDREGDMSIKEARQHLKSCPQASDSDRELADGQVGGLASLRESREQLEQLAQQRFRLFYG